LANMMHFGNEAPPRKDQELGGRSSISNQISIGEPKLPTSCLLIPAINLCIKNGNLFKESSRIVGSSLRQPVKILSKIFLPALFGDDSADDDDNPCWKIFCPPVKWVRLALPNLIPSAEPNYEVSTYVGFLSRCQ
jgi:hypothetical protein